MSHMLHYRLTILSLRHVTVLLQLDAARLAAYKASPMMEVVNMVGRQSFSPVITVSFISVCCSE